MTITNMLHPRKTAITIDLDFEPPFPLTLPARRHWLRISRQIHGQGRWAVVSHDLLASFCQQLAVSQELLTQITAEGVMVPGSRSERDRVRHPLWTPYMQCQQTLIRLARSIPLTDPKADTSGAALDSWIDEMVAG
jgi:phage terminase small subunit